MKKQKLFGTDGIRGKANMHPMTPELVLKLGCAIASHLNTKKLGSRPRIVIGKDTRLSGYMFETALTSGIVSQGCDVLLVGPMPTPAVAHLIKSLNCDAGIVLSASHNPAEDNGIKIFNNEGFKLSEVEQFDIESLIEKNEFNGSAFTGDKIGKAFRVDDARGRYIAFAKSSIQNTSLSGLKIVIDCANGAAYHIADSVFSELGADVTVINNLPDGLNINKNCGAVFPDALKEKVKESKADFGIALDGDADRIIVCDEQGSILDGDGLTFIFALALKEKNKLKNDAVVVTQMSNYGLDVALKKHSIDLIRTDVGDKYVVQAMREKNIVLGAEQSGHVIFLDYATAGDGIIAGLQLAAILKQKNVKLSQLTQGLKLLSQVQLNVPVKQKTPLSELKEVIAVIIGVETELKETGRVFIRYSGTQDLVRILVEGPDKHKLETFAAKIEEKIKQAVGA
jgi:phosphoglucosamine mutase